MTDFNGARVVKCRICGIAFCDREGPVCNCSEKGEGCEDEITMEDKIKYLESQEEAERSREEVAHYVRRDED